MKLIIKLSLTISLLGIMTLLILSNLINPKSTDIKDITPKHLNKMIKIHGTIFNMKSYPDISFQVISIKDETGKIDITTDKILDLKNNQEITVTGLVKDYKGFLQVEAETILDASSLKKG